MNENKKYMENPLLEKVSSLSDLEYNILNTSSKYFEKYGYYKSSVENIANDVGIGKGTIYRHFGNKSGLLYHTLAFSIYRNFNVLKKCSKIEDCYEALNYYITELIKISKLFFDIKKDISIIEVAYVTEAKENFSFIKDITDINRLYVVEILLPIILECTREIDIVIDESVVSEYINVLISSYCSHTSLLTYLNEDPSNIITNGDIEIKRFIFRAIGISEDISKKYIKNNIDKNALKKIIKKNSKKR